jgi:hypothetical protein
MRPTSRVSPRGKFPAPAARATERLKLADLLGCVEPSNHHVRHAGGQHGYPGHDDKSAGKAPALAILVLDGDRGAGVAGGTL